MREAIEITKSVNVDELESGKNLLKTAMIIAIVYVSAITLPAVTIYCCVEKCREHSLLPRLVIGTIVVELGCGIACIILSIMSGSKYNDKSTGIKDLDEAVEGCSDAYTEIPNSAIPDQVDDPAEDGKTASALLAVFGTLVVIKMVSILLFGARIKFCGKSK